MGAESKIRILCVDDHAEIRRLFELIMRSHADLETVGTLDGAEGLEESVENLQPDVVVLDLSMPGRDPLQAMKSARARFPGVQFLISSSYDDQAMIDESQQSGATGYLIKDGALDALADAIRKVARGERVVPGRRPGTGRSERFRSEPAR